MPVYTVGAFDEADPETIARFGEMIPDARVVVIPDAAHITAWDTPASDVEAVRTSLREVDARALIAPCAHPLRAVVG